jgi:hypothetical protein
MKMASLAQAEAAEGLELLDAFKAAKEQNPALTQGEFLAQVREQRMMAMSRTAAKLPPADEPPSEPAEEPG